MNGRPSRLPSGDCGGRDRRLLGTRDFRRRAHARGARELQVLEAEALWGRPIREKADALRALVRKFNAAAEAFIANAASGGEDFASDRVFGKQIRSEVFETGKDNSLSASFDSTVQEIEDALRPHLARV